VKIIIDSHSIIIEEWECCACSCGKHFYLFKDTKIEHEHCPYCGEITASLYQVIGLELEMFIRTGLINCIVTQSIGSFNPIKSENNINPEIKVTIDKSESEKIMEFIRPYLSSSLASN